METILTLFETQGQRPAIPPTSSGSPKGRYRNSRTSHARASFQSRILSPEKLARPRPRLFHAQAKNNCLIGDN
jgi:hypothetical protein